jgi:membrane associated rhomboid family serine protease
LTYLGFWIVSQIFSGTLALALPEDVGGVALWAHVGGFIAGAVLCWLFVKSQRHVRSLAPDEWGLEGGWHRLQGRYRPWV